VVVNIMNYATRRVHTVEPGDSIDKAISMMEEHGIHHLVVAKDLWPLGMLSDRDVLTSTGWMLAVERSVEGESPHVVGPQRVEQIMSRPVISLTPASDAHDAACVILDRKISAIPIVNGGLLVGLLTETDLLRWLGELAFDHNAADRLLRGPVRELMRARVMRVAPEAPLGEVIDVFRRYRVRHVPVTVNSSLLGVISDRDVRRCLGWSSMMDMQAEARGRMSEITSLSTAVEVMQLDVQTISSAAPLREALQRMLEARIHSLPVVDERRLVGIITQTDFVKAIARDELL
jgi:CBS domain-containing protein